MTSIRSELPPTPTTALNGASLLLASASEPPATPGRVPNGTQSLPSDQTIVLPPTLTRTQTGFGVRVDSLGESQKRFYDRLIADRFTPAQINEVVTVIVRGGVDGLAGKYSRLSVDNLACLSHIINNLNSETAPHDAAHMLLGNRTKIAYGVSELSENVGNALGNNWLSSPQGLYEGFRVERNESGGLTVAAVPGTREQVSKVFSTTVNGSRVIDTDFRKTFLINSETRVWFAADTAMASPNLPFEARFALFYRELEASGQVPVKGNTELTATLKKMYARLEDSVAGQTPSELRTQIVNHGTSLISLVVATYATEVFKSMPDAKRFEFFADFIAMVVAMNNHAPNQITLPTETTSRRLFKTEWTDINTQSVDPATGTKPLAAPGFLRDFLDIRNQVRKLLGVPAAPVAVPPPATQESTAPNNNPNSTQAPGSEPGTTSTKPTGTTTKPGTTTGTATTGTTPGTTTAAPGTTPGSTTTAPSTSPKPNKGGYVQRPDAPKPAEIEKPFTFPLLPAKKAGPLHPPSRKPDADPRAGLFTTPNPKPRKARHTGDTTPRPKHDPNPPRFPDISNVPEANLPTKLPNKLPNKAPDKTPRNAPNLPSPTSGEYTWSTSRVNTKPFPVAEARTQSLPTPPRSDISWSTSRVNTRPAATASVRTPAAATTRRSASTVAQPRVNTSPTRAAAAPPQPQRQGIAGLQDQLKTMQRELDKLPKNAAPTLAQAQATLARLKVELKAFITEATAVVKQLPAQMQGAAMAQLQQLQAAWDRWSPGALNNLESFGNGATQLLAPVLAFLAGTAALLDDLRKIFG